MKRFLRLFFSLLVILAVIAGAGWIYVSRSTDADRLMRIGREAIAKKDWDTAEEYSNRLIAFGHADHGRLLLGESYFQQKKSAQAIATLNRLRDEGDLRVEAALIQGLSFLDLGNHREAERTFLFVLENRPDDIQANRGMATIAYDQGLWTSVEKFLTIVMEKDPRDGRPHWRLGTIALDQNHHHEAEQHLKRALELELPGEFPSLAKADLAMALAAQKKFDEALKVIEELDMSNQPTNILRLHVDCFRSMGLIEQAEATVDRYLSGIADDAGLMAERGLIMIDQRRFSEAARDLEKSLAKDAHDLIARDGLRKAYQELGRTKEAAEQQKKFVETEDMLKQLTSLTYEAEKKPWDPVSRRKVAELCSKLNKPEMAKLWAAAAIACEVR